MQKISILLVFLSFMIWLSCSRDVAPEITCEGVATYELNMKMIVETNCVYSGCHDGGSGVNGVFFDYEGLKPFLDDGGFEGRVVSKQDMPPSYATGPKELTPEELDLVVCWIAEGYPQN